MKIKTNYLLIVILALSLLLRIYKIASVPPSLTSDEAALGYNAYSILKTGRDEHGQFLPFVFKSFGDYKPGLYVYLTVPFVYSFGLNEIAVRLPSVIAGVLAIYFLFLITSELTKNISISLVSALILSLMPWHIHFSRGAWEANVDLTLTLGGLYFFLNSFRKEKFLILSSILFALTALTYQGAKLASPIVILLLALVYWKSIIKYKKSTLVFSVFCGFLISLPIIVSIFRGETGRLKVFSIFSYPRSTEILDQFLSESSVEKGSLVYDLFYSEALNFTRGIAGRWFNHFSARFLFFEGDWANPRHSAPNHGVLLIFNLISFVAGIVYIFSKRVNKNFIFILLWLFFAPFPASLSRDQVHAVRAYNMVIPITIISACGLVYLHGEFKRYKLVWASFLMIAILSLVYYLDSYFVHLPSHDSFYWNYGYKQVVEIVTPIQKNYKEVRIQQSYAQPYIYFLFYNKYDPSKYQKKVEFVESENKNDVGKVEWLDNLHFSPIDWNVNKGEKGMLLVADTISIPVQDSSDPEHFNIVSEIKYLNGETAFRIIEVKK